MKHIYCIPGFGADEKLFSKFKIPGYELHFIQWVTPEKNESITSYATRLSQQIQHDNPVLVGVSFGGMICIEISRLINAELIIIISSIKLANERPFWMNVSGRLKLNRLFPMHSYKIIRPIADYNLGITTKEESELVNAYRKNLDIKYSNWAVNTILNWKNDTTPHNLYHIHGDKDRMFSIKKIIADYTIPNGGHLMILNKSGEVNECVRSILLKHTQ